MSNITRDQVKTSLICAIAGGVLGAVGQWLHSSSSKLIWVLVGGLAGGVVGLLSPLIRSFASRHQVEDWRLEEVEIHGLKFTSAGAQRRVAWRLFVEMTTRIATQPMQDDDGDDGVALKSLYDLFQVTRTAVSEMQLTPNATGDTVETYALDMLNSDLRPFLSRWHPVWSEYAKSGGVDSAAWEHHEAFRAGLRELQTEIEGRARGLAQLAGIKNIDRFFVEPKLG